MVESINIEFVTNSSSMAVLILVLDPKLVYENIPPYEKIKQDCEYHPFITQYLAEYGCKDVAEVTKQNLEKAYYDLVSKMKQQDEPYQINISASIDGEGIHESSAYYYAMMIVADCVFDYMKDIVEPSNAIIFGATRTNSFNKYLRIKED